MLAKEVSMRADEKKTTMWFVALAALGLCLVVAGASQAQAQVFHTDSPSLKQFLQILTPAARRDAVNALRALTPAGPKKVESAKHAPGSVRLAAQLTVKIHASLPPRDRKRYMKGLFAVSPEDRRFAIGVIQRYHQILLQELKRLRRLDLDLMKDLRQLRSSAKQPEIEKRRTRKGAYALRSNARRTRKGGYAVTSKTRLPKEGGWKNTT
jgi:hypothetical protein